MHDIITMTASQSKEMHNNINIVPTLTLVSQAIHIFPCIYMCEG